LRLQTCIAAAAALVAISLAPNVQAQSAATIQATLRADRPGPVIAPEIQGQFAEHLGTGIYDGVWVGPDSKIPNTRGMRNDVMAALKRIKVPVVRWPGGCFADDYHWRDGIGPRAKRPVRVNVLWGGVEESNAFGTHEFFDFAEQLGTKTYVAVNVGTGTPRETGEWLEYMTSPTKSTVAEERRRHGRDQPFKVDYVGVGNENWGCGGQMRPEYYADLYRNHAEFVRAPRGTKVVKVAGGANSFDYKWTEVLMERAGRNMDALSVHYYTIPTGVWEKKGDAVQFDEAGWHAALFQANRMEELISGHAKIMDKHDPEKKVGLYVDEWGLWHDPTPGTEPGFLVQQNTLRDAVAAALTLNIFHRHVDRVRMANIAQMVNVLQAMILTDKEKMALTPTYHVFDLYKVFQGATSIPVELQAPDYVLNGKSVPGVHASAGRDAAGVTHVALVNLDPNRPARLNLRLAGLNARAVSGQVLTAAAMNSHNTFDQPDAVRPVTFNGARLAGDRLDVSLPSKSVVVLALR
jgi:alpha-N-arabinofuranosidase